MRMNRIVAMAKSQPEIINVLLIEDHSDGSHVIKAALENAGLRCRFHTLGSGPAALEYLHQQHAYKDVPTPDLMFFDLIDPTDKDISLLQQIKADEKPGEIPLILLTGPDSEKMLNEAYKDNANFTCFTPIDLDTLLSAIKPLQLDRFLHAIELIDSFGFVLARMPDIPSQKKEIDAE